MADEELVMAGKLAQHIDRAILSSPLGSSFGEVALQAISDAGYTLRRRGKPGRTGRAVLTPLGEFPSVAAAARALKIEAKTLAYFASVGKRGIRYKETQR